jgi:hypothetical protein
VQQHDAPAAPAPSTVEAINEQIDEIMRQNPPGTDRYTSPKVQRALTRLHARLPNGPVVGQGSAQR